MLLNLLARQSHEIREVELLVPSGVVVETRLSPLIPAGLNFDESLRAGVEQINPGLLIPKGGNRSLISVRVGPGELQDADLALSVSATGWCGYVGQVPADCIGEDTNPIGAYVGACLGAGEVFKYARSLRPGVGNFARRLWLDAFGMRILDDPTQGPPLPNELRAPDTALVGVGAVGNGFLHVLYPLENLRVDLTLIDNDPEGVDITNLNRAVLFGLRHVASPQAKASAASEAMGVDRLTVAHPVDGSWQAWRRQNPERRLDLVISAVDKNSARHAIQDALPRLIIGAATNGMRAQVNLYDVGNGGPCLRCRNKPEAEVPDHVVIERLRELDPAERKEEAHRVGVNPYDLDTFLSDPSATAA
jgi:hypothetical protein